MRRNLDMKNVNVWRLALAGLTLASVSSLSWAAAVVQAITSSQQGGSDVVRVELSEALSAVPPGFVVQAPPRIAIDLPGVTSGLAKSVVDINQGNVRTVNVAQAGDRTRLVLNLRQATTYRAQLQGKTLMLVLDPAVAQAPAPAPAAKTTTVAAASADNTVRFAENQNTAPLAL